MWIDDRLVELKPHGHIAVHIAFASSPNEDVVPATPELTVFAFAELAAKCTLFVTLCRIQQQDLQLQKQQRTDGKHMHYTLALGPT